MSATVLKYEISQDIRKREENYLNQPITYAKKTGGTTAFKKIVEALNNWFELSEKQCDQIQDVFILFIVGAQMSGDTMNETPERNDAITTHRIYGRNFTLNSSSFLMIEAMKKMMKMEKCAALMPEYISKLKVAQEASSIEMFWRDSGICPTLDEYYDVINTKFATGFQVVFAIFQKQSNNKKDFSKFIELFARYIAVRKDYKNVATEEFDGEPIIYCEDLMQGKVSWPVIWAVQNHPNDNRVMETLRRRPKDQESKRAFTKLLDSLGAFDAAKECMKKLDEQIRKELENLGENTSIKKALIYLREF